MDRRFNRGVWGRLEDAVRESNKLEDVYEVYVASGPIYDFRFVIKTITTSDNNPIKYLYHICFFKSVLAERRSGAIHMWSFVISHESSRKSLDKFQVPTTYIEVMVGVNLWSQLTRTKIMEEKNKIRSIWEH